MEVPRPTVQSECARCGVSERDVRAGRVIVSPTGRAHFGTDYGVTACGIDATGPHWWWPL